jgi:hypothetical protein
MANSGPARHGGAGRPAGRGKRGGPGGSGARGTASAHRSKSGAAAQRAIQGAKGGRRGLTVVLPIVVVVVIAAAVVVGLVVTHKSTPPVADPTQHASSALLASTNGQATGQTIDGVSSNNMEQVLFHIHAHLAIYVNGTPRLVPYGVGIVPPYQLQQTADGPFVAGGTSYYWLHTHDQTGVVHIESPVQQTYTLGQFFDIWKQPLRTDQVGPAKGAVTVYVNGSRYSGDPRTIPLTAHATIQLDVGKDVPFAAFTFPSGL